MEFINIGERGNETIQIMIGRSPTLQRGWTPKIIRTPMASVLKLLARVVRIFMHTSLRSISAQVRSWGLHVYPQAHAYII